MINKVKDELTVSENKEAEARARIAELEASTLLYHRCGKKTLTEYLEQMADVSSA